MKKTILVLLIIILILEIIVAINETKQINTGLHKIEDCVVLNDEVYCKISKALDEE